MGRPGMQMIDVDCNDIRGTRSGTERTVALAEGESNIREGWLTWRGLEMGHLGSGEFCRAV